jgi:hypothetical protein
VNYNNPDDGEAMMLPRERLGERERVGKKVVNRGDEEKKEQGWRSEVGKRGRSGRILAKTNKTNKLKRTLHDNKWSSGGTGERRSSGRRTKEATWCSGWLD